MSKHDDLVARAKELNVAGASPRWSGETLKEKIAEAEGKGDGKKPDAPEAFYPAGALIPGSTTPEIPDNGRAFTTAEAAIGEKSESDLKREEEDAKRASERDDPAGLRHLREHDKAGAWAGVSASNPEAGVFNEISRLGLDEDDGKSKKSTGDKAPKAEDAKGTGAGGPDAAVG